jgi:hypothetical protein
MYLSIVAGVLVAASIPSQVQATDTNKATWCAYSAGEGITQYDNCVQFAQDGTVKIKNTHLQSMDFSRKDGLVGLYYIDGTAYVNKAGKVVRTFTFDNGPDYFVEGLARMLSADGKFGFINRNLDMVIPPRYDFAAAFSPEGRAAFCLGCTKKKRQPEGAAWVGGQWGYIDISGKVVEGPMACQEFKRKYRPWLHCPQ